MTEPGFLERRIRALERLAAKACGVHFLSIGEIDELCAKVASQVVESGYKPDCVVGIKEAGHYPGLKVAQALGVDYKTIKISRDDIYCMGIKMNDRLILNKIASANDAYTLQFGDPFPETDYRRFLIIDDDCVSGETLNAAEQEIRNSNDVEDVKKGVLLIGKGCFEPEYVGEKMIPINWLIKGPKRFPWAPFSPHHDEYQDIMEDMFWNSFKWDH